MEYIEYIVAALAGIIFGNFLYTIIWLPRPPNFDSGGIRDTEIDNLLTISILAENYDEAEKYLAAAPNAYIYIDSLLFMACRAGNSKIVRLLLKNGANLHVGNDAMFRIAEHYNYAEVTAVLNEYVASENPTRGK